MFVTLIEIEIALSAFLGAIVGTVMLWKINGARRDRATKPRDNSLMTLILKAGWRYTILTVVLLCMLGSVVVAVEQAFDPTGILLLGVQPPLLLVLLLYEWYTDERILRLRRDRHERKEDNNQPW